MLIKIQITITLSILSCSIFAMDEKYIANRMDLQKAMVSTNLLPGIKTIIAQYLSDNWAIETNLGLHHKSVDHLSMCQNGNWISSSCDGRTFLCNNAGRYIFYLLHGDRDWQDGTIKYISEQRSKQLENSDIKIIAKISNDSKKTIIAYPDGSFVYTVFKSNFYSDKSLSQAYEGSVIKDLTFSENSKYLAISDEEGLNVFNLEAADMLPGYSSLYHINLKMDLVFEDNNIKAKAIVAYKDHKFLVASEQGIHLLDVIKEQLNLAAREFDEPRKTEPLQLPLLIKVIAHKLAVSNDSKYLAFLHENAKKTQAISIMNLESENKDIIEQLEFDNSKTCVNAFGMSNDGQYLAIGLEPQIENLQQQSKQAPELMNNFKTLKIYNVLLREYIKDFEIKELEGICKSLVFNTTNNDLFIGLSNGNIVHLKKVLDKQAS